MTRRSFLQTAMSTILTMGLGGLFSSRAAAAADNIRHLRQIVTTQPMQTRMIAWDSPQLLQDVRVEVSRADGKTDAYAPAYRYLAMDGETQLIYHAEIPVSEGASYRVIHPNGATAWIPLTRGADERTHALLFSDSQCGESYDVWHDVYHAAWQHHPNADFAAIVGDLTDNGESAWHWRAFFEAMEGANAPLSRHVRPRPRQSRILRSELDSRPARALSLELRPARQWEYGFSRTLLLLRPWLCALHRP